jgi:hypothetical protein
MKLMHLVSGKDPVLKKHNDLKRALTPVFSLFLAHF